MRVLTRYRRTLVGQRARVRNRVQKVLDRSGVRIGAVLCDVFGSNGRRILDGLAEGRAPDTIVVSLSHHVAHKLPRLGDALRLSLSAAERWLLCDLLREHDALQQRIQRLDRDIDDGLSPWSERIVLLQTIPGIDRCSACAILAEIGPDLDAFANAERLAAWAAVCPGNHESAGKRRCTRTRMGSKALRAVLVECAHGAARTHGCQFRGYHKALTVRRGYKRAIVATAHKLLRVLYVVLRDAKPYHDPEADYEALMVRRNAPRWVRMLLRHGLIEPAPTASARLSRVLERRRDRATVRGRPQSDSVSRRREPARAPMRLLSSPRLRSSQAPDTFTAKTPIHHPRRNVPSATAWRTRRLRPLPGSWTTLAYMLRSPTPADHRPQATTAPVMVSSAPLTTSTPR